MAQVRAGLVANLAPLGIQSTGYVLAAPTAPTIEIFPGEVDYDQSLARGLDFVDVIVRVTVSISLDVAAQVKLDEYLAPSGSSSVKALIESDETLGGVVQDVHVQSASGYVVTQTNDGGAALYCNWTVRVFA
jgi:hypothetical protein